MGQLIDRQRWLQGAGKDHAALVDALDAELRRRWHFDLEHRRWFDAGRSGSPVASVIRRNPGAEHRILKFCTNRQAQELRHALSTQNAFVRRHLVEIGDETIVLGDDSCAVLMRVAGDNIEALQSLRDLRAAERAVDYRTIVASLIGEWNDLEPRPEPRTVRSVVGGIVGPKRGRALRWIRKTAPRNLAPVSLLAGEAGRWIMPEVFVGRAHGDLNTRNILIPAVPSVTSAGFQLIDFDHFAPDAPLARDPMHLLVAMALEEFDDRPAQRRDFLKAIVDPDQEGISVKAADFVEVSRAVHAACAAAFPESKGFAGHWREQCLLALAGVALRHTGRDPRTKNPEKARQWCYDLAVAAAKGFTEIQKKRKDSIPRMPAPASDTAETKIIDRFFEREALTDRLAYGPHGVVSVEGERGVGKSKLIDVAIRSVPAKAGVERAPRRYHVRHLDVRTLVELIGGPAQEGSGSALVQLESVLDRLGDTPVVVAVEYAENLLDQTHRIDDPDLADAFDMLADEPDHRVSVVLETRHGAVLSAARPWPDDTVVVPALEQDDFLTLVRDKHPDMGGHLDALPVAARRQLWEYAGGNAHAGELICAVVGDAAVMTLPELIGSLHDNRHRPVRHLIEVLVPGLPQRSQDVLRALAALRTPVPAKAVTELVPGAQPSLTKLHRQGLVLRQGRLYWLSPADAKVILDQVPKPDRSQLFFDAAEALEVHEVHDPRSVSDLRYHFAELDCLLDAGEYPSAVELISELDGYLGEWNCSTLLRQQRERIRKELEDPALAMSNESALGGIYVDLGRRGAAGIAYGNALKLAGPDAAPGVLGRLHANLAAMEWAANDIDRAQSHFEYAWEKATEAGDRDAVAGSITGLADCHRRRGDFSAAIDRAAEAFAAATSEDPARAGTSTDGRTAAVGLAVRLSRWNAEQERRDEAHKWLEKARLLAESGRDWHRAAYLDGLADLRLAERLADGEVEEAVTTARNAADLARRVHDGAILLQARTTLCVAHLRAGRYPEASREIIRADRYRSRGRHLVVHGLLALTARLTGDRRAGQHFDDLLEEAEARIAADIGMRDTIDGRRIDSGPGDFGARHLRGFAQCGLAVDGRGDVEAAVETFRMTDLPRRPHAPGLVTRLRFLLEKLDRSGGSPGLLGPAIDALD
ncbi:hypothetical protein [Paractinoplanes atraurantiacus]|uniref:Tetratricopeptide repeat-containing protein n=1 Tax=Paractinoplanes atraurantiacus TaxID=1036182 RepID=A0A285HMJ2_9ACTN|nr:hypothetical protein [Actinoplanes atraurantiacus]SNY36950.1 hypothetical protein SAMN05421748_10518 [Actinoplanes atraurantiacus]